MYNYVPKPRKYDLMVDNISSSSSTPTAAATTTAATIISLVVMGKSVQPFGDKKNIHLYYFSVSMCTFL